MKEQDRFLPIANVSRIMKKALPGNAKISKDAKETVQECVSEFISFVTGEASDKCQREKRKTINGDDLLWAMSTLGFEEYADPLKFYLQKFREVEGERANIARQGDQPPTPTTLPPSSHCNFPRDGTPLNPPPLPSCSSSNSSNSLLHHTTNGANSSSSSLVAQGSSSSLVAHGVPYHPQGSLPLYHPSSHMMMPYHVSSHQLPHDSVSSTAMAGLHASSSSTPMTLHTLSSDHQPHSQPRKAS